LAKSKYVHYAAETLQKKNNAKTLQKKNEAKNANVLISNKANSITRPIVTSANMNEANTETIINDTSVP
jgi:hypothetical protein